MAYPTTIDSFPDPAPTSKRNAPSLANGQVLQNDAIKAIQTFVGPTGAVAGPTTIVGRVKTLESAIPTGVSAAQAWYPIAPATRTSRSFAWKGNIFTPSFNMTVYGIRIFCSGGGLVAANTVKAGIITVSAGAIASITTSSDTYTAPTNVGVAAPMIDFLLTVPVALTAGTPYGLVSGYSSTGGAATSTSDFPIYITPRTGWESVFPRCGTFSTSTYHIASLTPGVATAVTTSTLDQQGGDYTYLVAPIFVRT